MSLKLATHGGKFHADDCMAYAVLRLALRLGHAGEDHVLLRTRDPEVLAAADIVWDVGACYDPQAGRYDHHQRGAPSRADGTPYSALGLVWNSYGRQAVEAALDAGVLHAGSGTAPAISQEAIDAIVGEIDQDVVREVDLLDNGVVGLVGTLGFVNLVDDYNPPWDRPDTSLSAFISASDAAMGLLSRRIEAARARAAALRVVAESAAASRVPEVLELSQGLPWQAAAFRLDLPCCYAVFPTRNAEWMVDTLPTEPGGVVPRVPLPAAWAGLRDAALQSASGVADAIFVHQGRFIAGAASREGALSLAFRSLELAARPEQPSPRA